MTTAAPIVSLRGFVIEFLCSKAFTSSWGERFATGYVDSPDGR
jgi:hypothetical protein